MKQLSNCVITIIVNISVVKQHYFNLFNCLSLIEKNVVTFVRNVPLILNRQIIRAREFYVPGNCMLWNFDSISIINIEIVINFKWLRWKFQIIKDYPTGTWVLHVPNNNINKKHDYGQTKIQHDYSWITLCDKKMWEKTKQYSCFKTI